MSFLLFLRRRRAAARLLRVTAEAWGLAAKAPAAPVLPLAWTV